MQDLSVLDPKGLFKDVYIMEGITAGECRSVFLDWAISRKDDVDEKTALKVLHDTYALAEPDHPMSEVLRAALAAGQKKPRRRGGAMARVRPPLDE